MRLVLGVVLALALWTALGSSAAAGAQYPQVSPRPDGTEPRNPGLVFERIDVQVWPEYDAPQVLVLSEFRLPPGTAMPFAFQMAIPKGARVTALGEVETTGEFRPAAGPPPVDRSGGEWDVAQLEVKGSHVLLMEYYYDPGLDLAGRRAFEFLYEFPGDASESSLVVQRPARSADFQLDPKLDEVTTGPDGLKYEMQEVGEVRAGERYLLGVGYSKADREPSVEPATVAAAPGQEDHSARNNFIIVMAVLLVASLVALGLGIRARRNNSSPVCPECGEAFEPHANFCIECGLSFRQS
jgi:hypothetical protein